MIKNYLLKSSIYSTLYMSLYTPSTHQSDFLTAFFNGKKMPLRSHIGVLKEYKGSYGTYYIQDLSK